MEFTVHCLFCQKSWVIESRFDTDWTFTEVYTYCGCCRKLILEEFERQLRQPRLEAHHDGQDD